VWLLLILATLSWSAWLFVIVPAYV
jgi:hypothetical protein